MKIVKYEVARNAYADTPGKYHVRGVTESGLTQAESSARHGFTSRKAAQTEAANLNRDLKEMPWTINE